MTGVGLITLHGGLNQANAAASLARSDATAADVTLAAQPVTQDLTGEDLGTLGVLTPGVYSFASSAQLTGTLTLNFEGLNDPFVFLIGSTLTTASASSIVVENGNPSSAIFWWVGSSATLGTGTVFDGNILADQSITMNTGASIACGRALALNAAVTLDTNVVSNDCGAGDFGSKGFSGGGLSVSPTPEPTTWAMMLIGFGIVGGLGRATRRRRGFAPAA
jgi:type VI secretion system secreted protein VgrG